MCFQIKTPIAAVVADKHYGWLVLISEGRSAKVFMTTSTEDFLVFSVVGKGPSRCRNENLIPLFFFLVQNSKVLCESCLVYFISDTHNSAFSTSYTGETKTQKTPHSPACCSWILIGPKAARVPARPSGPRDGDRTPPPPPPSFCLLVSHCIKALRIQ